MAIVDQQKEQTRPNGWYGTFIQITRPVRKFFGRIANIGIEGYPPDTQRRLKIVNVFSALVVMTTFIYAVQLGMSGNKDMMPVVFLNLALALIVSLVPLMHRFNDMAGCILLVVAEFVALIGFTSYFGRTAGAPLQYVVAAAAPFVIFERAPVLARYRHRRDGSDPASPGMVPVSEVLGFAESSTPRCRIRFIYRAPSRRSD